MKLLGWEITRREGSLVVQKAANLQAVSSWTSSWLNWWGGAVTEPYAGAWQRNVTVDSETSLLAFSAVFSCVTGIASDVAKMRIKLMRETASPGIWEEIVKDSPFLRVLRKPNHYQNRIKFIEQWIVSKLLHGNAYILKEREPERKMVRALYVLDPSRVTPMVAEDGSVWYRVHADNLSQVDDEITIPASEIIHDMMVSLWHPLVGVSPIYACGISTTMGNRIQANSTKFFANMSRPSILLSAPGEIKQATADRLKAYWETNFGGENIGRVAILGDGLKAEVLTMPAEAAQLIEQLKWTVEDVGRAFHYPAWKMGGALPPYSSGPEALTMMYYTDCLQNQIESVELCLDEGIEIPAGQGTELDLDNLMRMDTAALYESNNKAVAGGWMAPNEARFRGNLKPVTGGESPMIQQQNYSLAALAKRDVSEDPFAKTSPPPAPADKAPDEPSAKDFEDFELLFAADLKKEMTALTPA